MDVKLRENAKGSITLIMTEGRQRGVLILNDLEDAMEINRQMTQEIKQLCETDQSKDEQQKAKKERMS